MICISPCLLCLRDTLNNMNKREQKYITKQKTPFARFQRMIFGKRAITYGLSRKRLLHTMRMPRKYSAAAHHYKHMEEQIKVGRDALTGQYTIMMNSMGGIA